MLTEIAWISLKSYMLMVCKISGWSTRYCNHISCTRDFRYIAIGYDGLLITKDERKETKILFRIVTSYTWDPILWGALPYFRDTAMYRECSAYVRTLAPVAGVSGGDRWLHPTVLCGMQLLVRAWDVCFWCQSPQMLTLIFIILIFIILDAKWIDLFWGVPQCACVMTCSAPSRAEVRTFLFWMVHCGMPGRCAVGWVRLVNHFFLLNRSVQIVVWYLWCWDLFYVILVCICFHVIFVSCDCIMKCIFVGTQVVNKLLLLL